MTEAGAAKRDEAQASFVSAPRSSATYVSLRNESQEAFVAAGMHDPEDDEAAVALIETTAKLATHATDGSVFSCEALGTCRDAVLSANDDTQDR